MPRLTSALPVILVSAAITGCATTEKEPPAPPGALVVRSVEFTATPAPSTDQEITTAYTHSSAIVTLRDGSQEQFPLSYQVLYNTGDAIGAWRAGTIVDQTGATLTALLDENGNALAHGPFYSHSPDGNSLLHDGDRISLITQFESDTQAPGAADPDRLVSLQGELPMVMNLARLKQEPDGHLQVASLENVDMGGVNGLWVPCAAERTPWNSHLGGEEYEPDARTFETKPLTPMNRFLGKPGQTAAQGGANAYQYGLITEVKLAEQGQPAVTKHYALGRLSNELAHVLPDQRTAYKGDDGRDTVLTMFVADATADLSAGTLYAAQVEQLDGANGGRFNLHWIRLGHASDGEIGALVAKGIRFSDIFDVATKTDYDANPTAFVDFRPIYVLTNTDGAHGNQLEYLRLKPGMEQAAAFLETRRFAAYKGATAEFTKMEGETSNNRDKKLYIAMSYVEGGMLEGKNGERPRDDIHLAGNPKDLACGIVYQSSLTGTQKDTEGHPIASDWVATDLVALVRGARKPADQLHGKYDRCDTDKMANPDNIKYSEALRTLFIGEDSDNHMNNFLWAYSVDRGTLTRIASTRFGAEWTGLAAVDDLNGHAYILGNIQHPGSISETARYKPQLQGDGIDFDTLLKHVDTRGAVGYLGGLPALQVKPAKR